MKLKQIALGFLLIGVSSCNSIKKEDNNRDVETYPDIKIVGEMKKVMWKGELGSSINLDTISNKDGLYGLGPMTYLTGELLVVDGRSYVSKVTSDSTMDIEEKFDVSAPFFVYANVTEWSEIELPSHVITIDDLEIFIDENTANFKRPFVFKLVGRVSYAVIHIQNLPEGAKVSSPDDAHQGQINFNIKHEDAQIIGFFSTNHKGVFTHHDSYLHMHLITKDQNKMGHLDELEIGEMVLLLPLK